VNNILETLLLSDVHKDKQVAADRT